jgi:peptidoglycan hydrolase FlgJ
MATIPSLAGQTAAASLSALTATGSKPALPLAAPGAMPAFDVKAKARANAVDFEATFISSMFNQMMTGIDGEGPFGGAGGAGMWRSFLSDEYAKSFAKAGGIGLADHVYRSLLAQQEVRAN